MSAFLVHLRRSFVLAIIATVLFGFAYAFLGTGVSQLLFSHQADRLPSGPTARPDRAELDELEVVSRAPRRHRPLRGEQEGRQGRRGQPPRGQRLLGRVGRHQPGAAFEGPARRHEGARRLLARPGGRPTPDLVTTSGSGYDPDITPQDAVAEIPMVSQATGISPARLKTLIASVTQSEQFGFLGSSIVDVLQLNEALAKLR